MYVHFSDDNSGKCVNWSEIPSSFVYEQKTNL
jgi:hypothetical protein